MQLQGLIFGSKELLLGDPFVYTQRRQPMVRILHRMLEADSKTWVLNCDLKDWAAQTRLLVSHALDGRWSAAQPDWTLTDAGRRKIATRCTGGSFFDSRAGRVHLLAYSRERSGSHVLRETLTAAGVPQEVRPLVPGHPWVPTPCVSEAVHSTRSSVF